MLTGCHGGGSASVAFNRWAFNQVFLCCLSSLLSEDTEGTEAEEEDNRAAMALHEGRANIRLQHVWEKIYSTLSEKNYSICLKEITAHVWKKITENYSTCLKKFTAYIWKHLRHMFEKHLQHMFEKKKLQHMSENILRIYFKINLQHMSGKKNLQHMSEKFTHACPFRGSVQNWHESGIKTFWFRHESGNFWIRNLKWKPTNPNSPVV